MKLDRFPHGFTLMEMMVSMLLAGIVMASVYQLLIGQSRSYGKQRELMDVHETLRSAAALLAWEIRGSGAVGGDLYSISANSITLRSIQAGGTVCATHGTQPRFGVRGPGLGDVQATSDDSALVFSADGNAWFRGTISQVWPDVAAGGVQWCDWGGGSSIAPDVVVEVLAGVLPPDDVNGEITIVPQGALSPGATVTFVASHPALACAEFDSRALLTVDAPPVTSGPMSGCTFIETIPNNSPSQDFKIKIELKKDDYAQLTEDLKFVGVWKGETLDGGSDALDYVEVGAPFRAFRRVEYGLYQDAGDGRWWLGRKVGAAVSFEKLTGPLLAPASGGLVLTYRDAEGEETDKPNEVAVIDFVLRAESYRVSSDAGQFQQDTLATRVALRG